FISLIGGHLLVSLQLSLTFQTYFLLLTASLSKYGCMTRIRYNKSYSRVLMSTVPRRMAQNVGYYYFIALYIRLISLGPQYRSLPSPTDVSCGSVPGRTLKPD
ncbi:hypothetical protein KC19_4G121700, partial [Ceratodon purpureus]